MHEIEYWTESLTWVAEAIAPIQRKLDQKKRLSDEETAELKILLTMNSMNLQRLREAIRNENTKPKKRKLFRR